MHTLTYPSRPIAVPIEDAEYMDAIGDLIENEVVLSMAGLHQHGETSTLHHSLAVSWLSYKTAKVAGLSARQAARGGLLHDLFLYDWHHYHRESGRGPHLTEHPKIALENAQWLFELTDIEKDTILQHMWPLTPVPPQYGEGMIVSFYDKVCGVREFAHRPLFNPADSISQCLATAR